MRVSKFVVLTCAGLMLSVSMAHAGDATAAAADTSRKSDVTTSTDDDDRMICEYEKKVGTHMKKRVCLTVAQRRELQDKSRREMDRQAICGNCKQL